MGLHGSRRQRGLATGLAWKAGATVIRGQRWAGSGSISPVRLAIPPGQPRALLGPDPSATAGSRSAPAGSPQRPCGRRPGRRGALFAASLPAPSVPAWTSSWSPERSWTRWPSSGTDIPWTVTLARRHSRPPSLLPSKWRRGRRLRLVATACGCTHHAPRALRVSGPWMWGLRLSRDPSLDAAWPRP